MSERRQRIAKKLNDNALTRFFRRIAAPFVRFYDTNIFVLQLRRFLKKNTEDNVSALSGQSAFFVILSFIPFILFVFILLTMILGIPEDVFKNQALLITGSDKAASVSRGILQYLTGIFDYRTHTIIITAVIALWSAGKGMYIITDGISRIYRLPTKHMWLFRRVFAMGYTFVLLVMILLAAGILVLNNIIGGYLRSAIEGVPYSAQVIFALRYVITAIIMILFLTLVLKLYLRRRIKERRYARFRVLLPGMIFTSVAWTVLTWGVEIYTEHFTSSLYGSFGTIIVVMMWVYFMMYLLLCGVQLNYIYREQFYAFRLSELIGAAVRKLGKKA